jgi:hypothetical protein
MSLANSPTDLDTVNLQIFVDHCDLLIKLITKICHPNWRPPHTTQPDAHRNESKEARLNTTANSTKKSRLTGEQADL